MPFSDRLAALVDERESQIVLGLDPDPSRVWPQARAAAPDAGTPAQRAAEVVVAHCSALIAAAGPACVAVKPQVACFERLGAPGWAALVRVADAVRAAGLLVLADAKRGDIRVTAPAYGQAFLGGMDTPFGRVAGVDADAMTVNPYMGAETIEPYVETGRGVFVLVRTSNPGAADFEEQELAGGGLLWESVARTVDRLGTNAVIGATAPHVVGRARELMPRATFLLPGVGAQGGRVEDLAPAFAPGRAGGLVTASRSIARAHEEHGGEPPAAARAEAERLREQAWALA